MGRFRSAAGAKYWESLDGYREGVLRDGTPDTRLFEIVDQIDAESRVPWLTFVLGSGCLSPTDGGTTPDGLSVLAAVEEGLAASGLQVDRGLSLRASAFVDALIAKKLPDAVGMGWLDTRTHATDTRVVAWRIAAAAALVAAVATTVYAELMSGGTYVVDRADKEVARIPPGADFSTNLRELKELLAEVQRLVNAYGGGGQQSVQTYMTLLKSVGGSLGSATQPELWRSQVEALTGFAWHFITDGTPIYPGWADMLLFQAANSSLNQKEFTRVPFLRVPVVQNAKPLDENSVLLERLRRVTTRSLEGDDGARDEFYDRVAQVLLQQAQLRRRGGSQLPLATAFIASFDLELELALWARIGEGHASVDSFAIVAPVYVVDKDAPRGGFNTELHWLWRLVTPGLGVSAKDLIARPEGTPGSPALGPWQRIDPSRRLDRALEAVPSVVHLSGAPLLDMGDDVKDLFGDEVGAVHHALLLDEHMAAVQFAEDLLDSPGPGQLHGEFLRSSTAPKGVAAPRFWAFVGTQLADPAIRFRLIANELRSLRAPSQQRVKSEVNQRFSGGDEHGGVVINDWVPAAEREVFRWFGYDVVKGRAQELVEHLDDFIEETSARIAYKEGGMDSGAA